MRELDFIAKQVEVTAVSLRERVARVLDSLRFLHDLTLALDDASPRDPQVVAEWLRRGGFDFDEEGYYERPDVLERARAGEIDPEVQIYYANADIAKDAEALRRMHALRGFARALNGITRRNERLAWFYYQDATRFVVVYPMHDPSTVVPPDFDWHSYFTYQSVLPEVNPKREIRWTDPNIDYGGKGLMVAASIPIYRNDELYGVWSVDVPVSSLVTDALVEAMVEGLDSWIVDRDGILLAHSALEAIVEPKVGDVYRKPLSELGGGYPDLDLPALWETGRGEVVDAAGESRHLVAYPLAGLDWLLVASLPKRGLLEAVEREFFEAAKRARAGDLTHRVDAVDGDLQPLVGAFNDMSEAVEAAMANKEAVRRDLERSRNHARALFDTSPTGLALVDERGRIDEVNRALAGLIAGAPTTLVGRVLWDGVEGEEAAAMAGMVTAAMRDGHAGPLESELHTEAGRSVPVRFMASRFGEDEQARVLLGVEDIRDRRLYQEQLLHSQKMQVVGKLAGGIAHDFNNLLTVILTNAAFIEGGRLEADAVGHHSQMIMQASERAAALTRQLLGFSRREVVQMRTIDVADPVREATELLERLLDERVKFAVSVEEEALLVRADHGQMVQVLMNLVINAKDALGSGGQIAVRVHRSADGAYVVITVADDGVGMADDIRSRVFEPFFTTKSMGTGLGLATVRDLVVAMGGSVSVESELGEGSTFRIAIPIVSSDMEAEVEKAARSPRRLAGTVLLVDDDALVRESAASVLRRHGVECTSVASAEEALVLLQEQPADLLVTDVVMPAMGGRELADRAHAILPELRVLFMSGYTDDAVLHHGVATDSVAFLRKPFSIDGLLAAVDEALSR